MSFDFRIAWNKMKTKTKLTFIGKIGVGIGVFLTLTATFRSLTAPGPNGEFILIGLGFIVLSLLGARKPVR